MAGRSLILYRIVHLSTRKVVQTEERRPRGGRDRETAPVFTRLELTEDAVGRGYSRARFDHREGVRIDGLWRDQRVREVVAVSSFPGFYHRRKGLFVLEAGRHLGKAAVDRLHRERRDEVSLTPVRLDFRRLLEGLPPEASIHGAWASDPAASGIRSRAAFGEDLAAHAEFRRMRDAGRLSNLSLSYPFAGDLVRVSVSRSCSAYLFGKMSLENRLRFMEHLATFQDPSAAPRSKRGSARRKPAATGEAEG